MGDFGVMRYFAGVAYAPWSPTKLVFIAFVPCLTGTRRATPQWILRNSRLSFQGHGYRSDELFRCYRDRFTTLAA